MAIDTQALVRDLQPLLAELREDLLARAEDPAVDALLRRQWGGEKKARRTADPFEVWRRFRATQVAAAWVLSVVFVRTLEDRDLLDRRRVAGTAAEDAQHQFEALAPFLTARDYLLTVFRELTRLPGVAAVFDARHNPVWVLAPSGQGAERLLAFFRRTDDEGRLLWRFDAGESTDTRFLGDLYQDLDADVRDRYALLQTPDFVEDFILENSLDPAIRDVGLKSVTLIDPACGSGHFLLGGFRRLLAAWREAEPATDRRELARRALGQIYGVDLNPYAVAIARFRLTLAFLGAAGYDRLASAPEPPLHLAVGDSLLYGEAQDQYDLAMASPDDTAWGERLFALEDEATARAILGKRHAVIVGNPPYITCKDKALRDEYRRRYAACHREYQLVAPFTERFFQLASDGGRVGLIVGNGFMKREFGKKLIEEVLPKVELSEVVDTSGAYIPGHGTPTVVLFGRNCKSSGAPIRVTMGKRGEPSTPEDPASGMVWSSIREHHQELGYDDDYVSISELARERLAKHPWSLQGGGASELKLAIEDRSPRTLGGGDVEIGFICMTRADDIYFAPPGTLARRGIRPEHIVKNVEGERIRDWAIIEPNETVFPYGSDLKPVDQLAGQAVHRYLWPAREILWRRREPNGDHRELDRTWWEWSRFQRARHRIPMAIAYAFVATHNHFVLDRGGKVFKQSAPVIKLPADATEDDHLALLGYLNSSTACFWMKQVMMNKGATSDRGVLQDDPEKFRFEFDGTKVAKTPLPDLRDATFGPPLLGLARALDEAGVIIAATPFKRCVEEVGARGSAALRGALEEAEAERDGIRRRMVAWQEELDWLVYEQVGLVRSPELRSRALEGDVRSIPEMDPDDRAYRHLADGEPGPAAADVRWHARRAAIRNSRSLRLLESPEHKRRWYRSRGKFNAEDVTDSVLREQELRAWLLDRAEAWLKDQPSGVVTTRELAAALSPDPKVQAVAEVYTSASSPDLQALFSDLAAGEAVPYAAALRYSEPGLEKRAAWERTWEIQRREDAGKSVDVPVPPKYAQKDFRSATSWRLRGKLDVPKERFVAYPGAEADGDTSPLLGWAGWDHLGQARALAALYQRRRREDGWETERLVPLLAGLWELVPWLRQWHDEPDPALGNQRAGEQFEQFVRGQLQELGLTPDDLAAWRPPKKARGRRRKKQ